MLPTRLVWTSNLQRLTTHWTVLILLLCLSSGCTEPTGSPGSFGQPESVKLISRNETISSDSALVAVLYDSMMPMAGEDWSQTTPPEPAKDELIAVFDYAEGQRWIAIQPKEKTYGNNHQRLFGDLSMMMQVAPIAEQLYLHDHWGIFDARREEWLRNQDAETVHLLLTWLKSENDTHRGYAARFLSLFRDHPQREQIESTFLSMLDEELQHDRNQSDEALDEDPPKSCSQSFDRTWVWDALPGIAGVETERKLQEWLNGHLCPNHATAVISAAMLTLGMPGSINDEMPGYCGVGMTAERAKEIEAEMWDRHRAAVAKYKRQIKEHLDRSPAERAQHVFEQWEQRLNAEDIEEWRIMTETANCARKLYQFGQSAKDMVQRNLTEAKTLNQSAAWGLVGLQMGTPIESELLDSLNEGTEPQRRLAEYIAATAESTGVSLKQPAE